MPLRTVDISRWYAGGDDADALAAEVDEGLQRAGFIAGHRPRCRRRAGRSGPGGEQEFFALPDEVEATLFGAGRRARLDRPRCGGQRLRRGHRDPARFEGELQPGCRNRDRRPEVDRIWFAPNVWPAEVAHLQTPGRRVHHGRCARLSDDLLALFAHALGLSDNPFAGAGEPADLDDEHQPLPAGECGR